MPVMLGLVGGRHEDADIAAEQVVGIIAEQGLRRLAESGDDPGVIDDDHGIRYRLENGPEVLVERVNVHLRHVVYELLTIQRTNLRLPAYRNAASWTPRSIHAGGGICLS